MYIIILLLVLFCITNTKAQYHLSLEETQAVYNELIILENKIYETNFNLNQMDFIKNLTINAIKRRDLLLELGTHSFNAYTNNIPLENDRYSIRLFKQIEKYNNEFEVDIQKNINYLYNKYINDKLLNTVDLVEKKKFIPRTFDFEHIVDYDLRVYQLINFNKIQKGQLNNLLNKYKLVSTNELKNLLIQMYEKKLK